MQLVRAAATKGSFDSVPMSDFRERTISEPIGNLQLIETLVDDEVPSSSLYPVSPEPRVKLLLAARDRSVGPARRAA